MNQRKICVITGNRAEYGLLYPLLKAIKNYKELSLKLIATTSHLSAEFGLTYKQIEKDGFIIDEKINNLSKSNTRASIVKSTGLLTMLLADSLEKLNPDIVLLIGDRYETHAAATASMLMNIPIAHIHGGEITEGAVDEQIRHSITKMSYLHFCSTEIYRNRIIQMGEDPKRVFNTGAPGIDNINNLKLLSKTDLEKKLDWNFNQKSALFTYHPSTLTNENLDNDLTKIFKVLSNINLNILFTYSNSDHGGEKINKKIELFCESNPNCFRVFKNLGSLKYLSVMNHVDLIIGNSSSGIIEAATFQKPVVNIGLRQKGRLRNGNVIDCELEDLANSIELALSVEFRLKCKKVNNIYGEGNTSEAIINKLISEPLSIRKYFQDI
jgi:GDP/UDP-N,N'-diacetylbacillosamine 2-epimerase (hydrolysing)